MTDSYITEIAAFERNPMIDELRGRTKRVLGGQGSVTFVDCMGCDAEIVMAARTSYGHIEAKEDDVLLRYLMRHQHTTPFEMAELKFIVEVPMDCWRQWIRHRTANVNEYSTRYVEAIDRAQETPPDKWREQAKDNKQGSGDFLPELTGAALTNAEESLLKHAREVYQQRLLFGVAKEQARKDLPLSTFTRAVWKCDLHNIFNFLRLRLDSHAQAEIREYANAIFWFVSKLFPTASAAFTDYVHQSMRLSNSEQNIINRIFTLVYRDYLCLCREVQVTEEWINNLVIPNLVSDQLIGDWWLRPKCRERDEFFTKLSRLGILKE